MSTTSSVKVTFYNANGTLNAGYSGNLDDNRSNVSLLLNGNLENVSSATLYVDSAEATSNDRKPFQCTLGEKITVVKGFSSNKFEYPFVDNTRYSLKCRIVFNDGTQIDGKFSISGATPTPVYNYLYITLLNEFSSATVTNLADIQNGSSIFVNAPFDSTKNTVDTRVPVKVKFTFDEKDEGMYTDNLEALAQYSAIKSYSSTGTYELLENGLTNGYSYALTIEGVYADGFAEYENVTNFFQVVADPVITTVNAYGLGIDFTGAGSSEISSVMDVTMETHASPTSNEKITFKLSQGTTKFYSYEVDIKTEANPIYYIITSDLTSTNTTSVPVSTTDASGNKYYAFGVTAERSYNSGALVKVSDVYSENFTLDITPLAAVSVANQWTALGLVGSSRTVALDSELTETKWNLISETGYAAKFSKTAFFGTGKTGLYEDLDTASTKFKIEASVNGGTSFAPVTSLRMKQGSAASSAAEDRTQWIDLLDDTPITNVDGLYDNIPWSTEALGTAQHPMYILGDCVQDASLILRVRIVADRITSPGATDSSAVEIMNKVNTPVAQSAYYSILNNKLYAVVNDTFSSSNDELTGVLFASNLASPNDNLVVPLPNGNTTNVFTLEVASPELRGTANPVLFKIAHIVDDDNGGTDITGLQGPETSVVCYNAPTKANFTVDNTNYLYKTVNTDGVSSVKFDFSMNFNNNSNIYGLRVYFSATSVPTSVQVTDIIKDSAYWAEVILSNKSFYSSWTDQTEGALVFVPLYDDKDASGNTVRREVLSESKALSVYKADTLPVVVVSSLAGGIVEADTVYNWTGASGDIYSVTKDGTEVSYTASGTSFSYEIPANSLTAGTETVLTIKKKVVLPSVIATSSYTLFSSYSPFSTEFSYLLPELILYGPTTTVRFTSGSVNTSAMVTSVLQGSDDDSLVTSFAAPTLSGNTNNQVNITEVVLGKVVSGSFSALTFVSDNVGTSTSTLQTATESNAYDISAETLSTLLDVRVQVEAGVDYTTQTGSNSAVSAESDPVTLPLGPSKSYRVAGSIAVLSNSSSYSVSGGEIIIPLTINANGMAPEGLSNAFAFISQASDYTDPSSDGIGATVFCLWSVHSPRTYDVGTTAVSSNTSDSKLAAGETAIAVPMNLVDGVNAIESGNYKLSLGNLTNTDSSSISFPSTGFNTNKVIEIMFVAQTRLGYAFVPITVNPPI